MRGSSVSRRWYAFPRPPTSVGSADGSAAGVLGDERCDVSNLLLAEAAGEAGHPAAARLDLPAHVLEPRPASVQIRSDLARSRSGGKGVAGTAARLLEDRRPGRRTSRGRNRGTLPRRRSRLLAVEPDRARVPNADQHDEEQAARNRKDESREAVEADDRDLGGKRAVNGAPEQRVRQHTGAWVLEAELEDAVVGNGQREREGKAARPAVHRIHPGRFGPGQLPKDPGGREELEAGQNDHRGREAGLQMDRIAEEEPEVALRPRLVIGEQSGSQREDREGEQGSRKPAVRPRAGSPRCNGLTHSSLSNRSGPVRSTVSRSAQRCCRLSLLRKSAQLRTTKTRRPLLRARPARVCA